MPVKTAPKKAVKTAKKAIPAIERAEQAIEQLALAHQKTGQAIERLTHTVCIDDDAHDGLSNKSIIHF